MVKSSSRSCKQNSNRSSTKLTSFFSKKEDTKKPSNASTNTNNNTVVINNVSNNYPLFNLQQQQKKQQQEQQHQWTSLPPLFCDLDGVLADHDKKMREKHGSKWRSIFFQKDNKNKYEDDFFNSLPWMSDGTELWNAIKDFHPTILTALPSSDDNDYNKNHDYQKRQWCLRELGKDVKVITTKGAWCKYKYCQQKNSILIDDRIKTKESWVKAGGIFIHHKYAKNTIKELKKLL